MIERKKHTNTHTHTIDTHTHSHSSPSVSSATGETNIYGKPPIYKQAGTVCVCVYTCVCLYRYGLSIHVTSLCAYPLKLLKALTQKNSRKTCLLGCSSERDHPPRCSFHNQRARVITPLPGSMEVSDPSWPGGCPGKIGRPCDAEVSFLVIKCCCCCYCYYFLGSYWFSCIRRLSSLSCLNQLFCLLGPGVLGGSSSSSIYCVLLCFEFALCVSGCESETRAVSYKYTPALERERERATCSPLLLAHGGDASDGVPFTNRVSRRPPHTHTHMFLFTHTHTFTQMGDHMYSHKYSSPTQNTKYCKSCTQIEAECGLNLALILSRPTPDPRQTRARTGPDHFITFKKKNHEPAF